MRTYAMERELAPMADKKVLLNRAVGATRFAQNWALDYVKGALERKEKIGWSHISLHTAWRQYRDEVAPWWAEESKETFQWGCERLATGLKNWSDSKKGKRKGARIGFPKKRKRGKNDSVAYTKAKLRACGKLVHIPRIGEIALKEKAIVPAGTRIVRVTVKAQGGRWFAVFLLREDSWVAPDKRVSDECIGIDLGVGDRVATLSTGEIVDNPRFYRSDERKLKRASRVLARRKKGSKRRRKARQKLARVHYQVKCRREDFIHKLTTEWIKSHDHIVIEDLAVKNMMKNRKLAKSFADVALNEIARQLIYKAEWYGCTLVIADRWFPSTQLCSECHHREKLSLSERYWVCPSCSTLHDRDYNAAVNLEDYGREFLGISSRSACKTSQFEAVRDETRIFDEERYLLAFGNEK